MTRANIKLIAVPRTGYGAIDERFVDKTPQLMWTGETVNNELTPVFDQSPPLVVKVKIKRKLRQNRFNWAKIKGLRLSLIHI